MVRMNKNSVGPQQRVEMRVLPYGGGSLRFSLLWLDRILEPKHLLDTCRKDETKERRRSFDVFLWTKLVGKLRKIDEARLRSTSLRWGSTGLVVHQLACTSTAPGEVELLRNVRAGKQTNPAAQCACQLLNTWTQGRWGT